MSPIHAAGGSDPGQVRPANEDAFWLGDSVFAVADGMGGHLAGEVASALALEPIRALDGRVFPDPETAVEALRDAVERANSEVVTKAVEEPDYRGMGTTLTAVLAEGRRIHFGHVGDSRAYLMRDGELRQLTEDHTLVQHLLDEGQITPEEAAHHPQRSIITRAIGVSLDVDVDSLSLDLRDGDQVLLCSDGLSGVVPEVDIAAVLSAQEDLESTVAALVDLANARGGPDNITCVLLRYAEVPEGPEPTTNGRAVGAQPEAARRIVVRTSDRHQQDDWAERLGHLGALRRDHDHHFEPETSTGPKTWQRVGAALVGLALLAAIVIGGGRWLLSRSYYVGLSGDQVVIYQGIPAELGPLDLSWEYQETDLRSEDLPAFLVSAFRDGRTAADLGDARRIVANARANAQESVPTPTPSATPPATPASPPAETAP